jgi:hypothetical protein
MLTQKLKDQALRTALGAGFWLQRELATELKAEMAKLGFSARALLKASLSRRRWHCQARTPTGASRLLQLEGSTCPCTAGRHGKAWGL